MKEQEYKVMCKKDYCEKDYHGISMIISYKPGEFYYARIRETYALINKEPNIPGGMWFPFYDFNECFHSPEETQNIIRTKLIDKILK